MELHGGDSALCRICIPKAVVQKKYGIVVILKYLWVFFVFYMKNYIGDMLMNCCAKIDTFLSITSHSVEILTVNDRIL